MVHRPSAGVVNILAARSNLAHGQTLIPAVAHPMTTDVVRLVLAELRIRPLGVAAIGKP